MSRSSVGKRNSRSRHGHGIFSLATLLGCVFIVTLSACAQAGGSKEKTVVRIHPYYKSVDLSADSNTLETLNHLLTRHRAVPYRDIWQFLQKSEQLAGESAFIRLFYTRRVAKSDARASGKNQSKPDYWNREHVWPQSYGLKKTRARTDLHNIVATDRTVNASRGNKAFKNGGKQHSECLQCKSDRSGWEPPDEVKGDVARIVFYMVVRYDGNDWSGASDLDFSSVQSELQNNRFGNPELLFEWHCQDPVSDYELRRNDLIHELQGNRNPFIDYPAWSALLVNKQCGDFSTKDDSY